MKKVYFIRHGPLQGKFSEYSTLEYNDFNNLLLKKVAPPVDEEKTKKLLQSYSFLANIELIFCSSQNRGIETAKVAKELGNASIKEIALLNEVDFYDGILTEEEAKRGMNTIRKVVLTKWYLGIYSEKFEESIARFNKFIEIVRSRPEKTILCITHGWFMRIIQVYTQKGTTDAITLFEVLEQKPEPNLGIIEINLE